MIRRSMGKKAKVAAQNQILWSFIDSAKNTKFSNHFRSEKNIKNYRLQSRDNKAKSRESA